MGSAASRAKKTPSGGKGRIGSGEPGGPDRLTQLFSNRTQMAISELLPFLDCADLVKLYRVNRYTKSLMTPSDPRCLRFDILFQRQSNAFAGAEAEWLERICEVQQPQVRFSDVMRVVFEVMPIKLPKPFNMENQKYKKTYKRTNPELHTQELMGYGGDSGTMNKDYFIETTREDSVFGMKVL